MLLLNRPVAAWVLVLAVLGAGFLALRDLSVDLLPRLDSPMLLIRTDWSGASPREVERRLNEPIESLVGTVPGVEGLHSLARPGQSVVSVTFAWGTDMDLAFLNTRERLERARALLPEQAERPELTRADPSEDPVMVLGVAVSGEEEPSFERRLELNRWAVQVLARRLEHLDGVAQALVVGGVEPEVRIRFDPARLDRYGLSPERVRQALLDANRFTPAGELRDGWYRYAVQIRSRIGSLDDIRAVPLLRAGETLLRLGDLAEVDLAEADPDAFALADGRPLLTVLVQKDHGTNTVAVVRSIRPVLDDLGVSFPGIALTVLRESAGTIEATVRNLLQTLALGALLAFAVLFAFLRDPRLPFTVGLAIPVSLGLTFAAMALAGVQVNIVSLSGLTLGIGLLVDNAIIVLENINRHRDGRPLREAVVLGTREIAWPATASTLTTLSVFAPLLALGGFEGALFRDQAFTLSVSLLASLLVALFLLPVFVMQARPGAVAAPPARLERLTETYERLLQRVLKRPGLMLASCLMLLTVAGWMATRLPVTVLPIAEPARLQVRVALPPDAALASTRQAAQQLHRALDTEGTLALGGYTDRTRLSRIADEGPHVFRLDVPVGERRDSLLARLEAVRTAFPGWSVTVTDPDDPIADLLGTGEPPLLVRVVGEDREARPAVVEGLRERFPDRRLVYRIRPDGDALLRYGLPESALIRHLETVAQGWRVTEWQRDDESVDLRLFSEGGTTVRDPRDLRIPHQGRLIPLTAVARIETTHEPAQLERVGQAPVTTYVTDAGLAQAWRSLETWRGRLREASVATGTDLRIGGGVLQVETLVADMRVLIGISLVLIFLILAIQYEHLGYPLLILVSVPFAWIGAVAALWLGGAGLNVMSFMGLLILTGIAVNDAILKVDFMRRYLRDTGDLEAAIREAGRHRFRPVVMTSLTTILGLVPLLIPFGDGLETRLALGLALTGGLVSSTLLTLVVVPVLFRLFHFTSKDEG